MNNTISDIPQGTLDGLKRNWKADMVSGFLVFLIALPLCLAISLACGYPAIAGVFTAIIGGILSAFISNSELTIKGPAAGLIVIALGCVTDFGYTAGVDPAADYQAYRLALGVGVAAGAVQILFGLFRSGILGEFFPTAAVHGLLASIGIIVISSQLPIVLGVESTGGPIEKLLSIPSYFMAMNPVIALIGGISLAIMFGFPFIKNPMLKMIPAPMMVLLVAVPLGMYFDIGTEQIVAFAGQDAALGPHYLVDVPDNMFTALTFPDFSGVLTSTGITYIIMFSLIGSVESLLSAKAVDQIDPWRRKTNMDKDLLAVGIGNTAAAFVGGLPMISEIVRSKANIDNGARTRFANMFHGLFLLAFVALVPALIDRIPLTALAAMLVFTGFRLASPKEFVHMYQIGREQLIVFVSTVIGVLATDLLVGIGIGILVKAIIHVINGAPIGSLFKPSMKVENEGDDSATIKVDNSAIFSTWIALKNRIGRPSTKKVIVDLSGTKLVDHTVMANLEALEREFAESDRVLLVTGLDGHSQLSEHPLAARKKV
ncbi:MAG: SulP family inorganic anion transporter [Proteobacteria bacterium]|jgi:MFS superfamily sulfate permease-like transporter|nr:SulP family inorganic anion transporter [Pseudomonadota bacterium]